MTRHTTPHGTTNIENLGDYEPEVYEDADKNLDKFLDSLEKRLEEYSQEDYFDRDEARIKHIIESDKKVKLAKSGGFFVEIPIDEEVMKDHKGDLRFLTSSEIPSHLSFHNIMPNLRKGKVKIQFSTR